jgi:hypothetical protein
MVATMYSRWLHRDSVKVIIAHGLSCGYLIGGYAILLIGNGKVYSFSKHFT